MDGKLNPLELLSSKRILVLLLIFVFLPKTILERIDLAEEDAGIFEGVFGEAEGIKIRKHHSKFKRSVDVRARNTAPCTEPGRFLNENITNGRWYWYCFKDENGNLRWMNMRCPNKRLFDPAIIKCVVNLTSTTVAEPSSTTPTTIASTTSSSTSGPTSSTTGPTSSVTGLTTPTTVPTPAGVTTPTTISLPTGISTPTTPTTTRLP